MKVSRKVGRRSRSSVSRRRFRNNKNKKSGYKKRYAKTQRGGARGYSSISRRRLRKSKSGSKKRYTQRGRYGGADDMVTLNPPLGRMMVDPKDLFSEATKIATMSVGDTKIQGKIHKLKMYSIPALKTKLEEQDSENVSKFFLNLFFNIFLETKGERDLKPDMYFNELKKMFPKARIILDPASLPSFNSEYTDEIALANLERVEAADAATGRFESAGRGDMQIQNPSSI
jgi:hypothetical protein